VGPARWAELADLHVADVGERRIAMRPRAHGLVFLAPPMRAGGFEPPTSRV